MAEQHKEQKNEVDNQAANELNEQEAQLVIGGVPPGSIPLGVLAASHAEAGMRSVRAGINSLGPSAKAEVTATATGTAAAGAVGFFSPEINKL